MKSTTHNFTISPKTLVLVALGIIGFIFIIDLRTIILSIAIALIIATFMNGPIKTVMRLRLPRAVASVIVYLFLLLLFGGLLVLLIPVFMNEVQSFIQLLPKDSQFVTVINVITDGDTLRTLTDPTTTPKQTASLAKELEPLFGKDNNILARSGSFLGGIVSIVLTLVLAFYFSIENEGVDRFLRLITPRNKEDYVVGLWHRVRRKIELWFRGQVILACILGALTYIALLVLAVPYALLLSLIAVLFSIIPFGIVLATIPAVLIAFMAGGLPLALIVLGIYILLQQLENNVFQPIFVKRATGLPPVVVIISLAAGATIAGAPGLLIAVPVAVLLLEILSDHEQRRSNELQM